MLMYFFLHIVEVLNVLNLCERAVNSAIFHLFCTFLQGQLVKSKKQAQYIPYRYIFKTQYLLLSMFDMNRSLALLYM